MLGEPGKPRREQRRRDAGQIAAQVGEALIAEQQLAQNQQAPAIADQIERAGDRTVVAVTLHALAARRISTRAADAAATARIRRDAASAASASAPTTGVRATATFL
jgi:hypothetical protein